MSGMCPYVGRGQMSSSNIGPVSNHQALFPCQSKHLWLLGMLWPCPMRRRATRTARGGGHASGFSLAEGSLHYKVSASSRAAGVRALGPDDNGTLHVEVENSLPDMHTWSGQEHQRHFPDAQPLQLANKPQPRARARPSLAALGAAEFAPDADTSGQRTAERAALSEANAENALPAESSSSAAPSSLSRDPAPLGLKAKTLIVRRKLAEQGFTLLPPQTSASPLSPRVGNFMPQEGERVSQRRLAHINKAVKRVQRATRKAASEAGGVNDVDSVVSSTSAAAAGSRLSSYGYPPLSSVHSDGADSSDFLSPDEASTAYSASTSGISSRPTSPSAAAASSVASRYYELPPPGTLPRPTRAEVERLVRECADLGAVRMLYGMYGARLTREELVLLVNQLAEIHDPSYLTVKLWTATQAMLVELLQRITPSLKELTMQEYVMMLAGVAKLRYVPPNDWIAAVLTQSKPRLYNASPSNLAHVLKAIARITVDPADVKSAATWEGWMRRYLTAAQRQLQAFRADELVKTLVALSELRYRPSPEWMHKFSSVLHSRLEVLEAHSLSEAMLAFAALRYQPEGPFLRAYYSQLYARLPLADDQDLATYAQAAALLDRVIRQDFMQEFLAEVVEKLPTFKPQHLANLLNAMGRLATPTSPDRVRVPPGWTAAVAAHVSSSLPGFSGSALASAAWGLSMLGHRARPQFLDDLLSASYGKLHTCGPTDLILLATALGNLGFAPMLGREALWATWMAEFERFAARKTYDTRGVCDLMDAIARLPRPMVPAGGGGRGSVDGGLRPQPLHPDFIAGVLRSTRIYQLRNTSPGRLAALAGALATLGVKPDFGFLYNYAQAARVMWTSFGTRDYAKLLGAMVHIGTPGLADSRWAADFLAITLCRMSEFDGPSLAASLDALRRLPKPEFTPSSQWLAAAAARAVELIRSPPPPLPHGAAAAAALAPVPAAAMAAVAGTVSPLKVMVHGTASAAGGKAAAAPSPPSDWWVLPMRPLTPELLVVLVEALAALGYRTESKSPLVNIVQNLLSTTTARRQLQERISGVAPTVTPLVAKAEPSQILEEEQQQQQPGSNATAVAAAFERAKAAAAVAAAAATGEAPRPPLDRQQAAALEGALRIMLGLAPPSQEPSASPAATTATTATAATAAAPMLPGLPSTALRSPKEIADTDAAFTSKRAQRAEKRANRPVLEKDELAFPAVYLEDASSSATAESPAGISEGALQPGVRLPPYSVEPSGHEGVRPQSAPSAGSATAGGGATRGRRDSGSAVRRRRGGSVAVAAARTDIGAQPGDA